MTGDSIGMGFASNKTLVDATIGRPHVVTLGVRERVVKPATEFAGFFAMSRVIHLPIERSPARARCFFHAVILAVVFVTFGFASVYAGSAAAEFRVSARVIKSCKVSADALAAQATKANGTSKVNCQNSAPTAGSAAAGSALSSGTANVNVSIDEVQGSDGALKIVTVNY